MIIIPVKIQKLFIGQIRNIRRVSAGFHTIGRIRIKRLGNLSEKHLFRRRKSALHLIIDDPVVLQRTVHTFKFIVPALLHENFFKLINVRMKYRVQINVHQILEICIVTARHRINGFIRIGHGIQKSIQRPLDQFYKRVLDRKFFRTAEYRVFQNMCNARAVCRRRPKCHMKYLIVIIIG